MRQFFDEFKKFILRGNLIEIAVAFILGLYFKAVVDSFVNGIVLNIVAAIVGQPDFSSITIHLGDGRLLVGAFIGQVITFVIVAFVLFLIIQAFDAAKKLARRDSPEEVEPLTREGELLQEIRDLLRARS
ncbi:MAG: large conductance mechanosensitive channel [Actinomycetota bacterium]|nr:large conductance mechanosensitive channel [Actinomycetota bacterium]